MKACCSIYLYLSTVQYSTIDKCIVTNTNINNCLYKDVTTFIDKSAKILDDITALITYTNKHILKLLTVTRNNGSS